MDSVCCCGLSSKWCFFFCIFEFRSIGGGLRNYLILYICNSDNGIIEICLNMNNFFWYFMCIFM